jgi:hypothetical protein
MLRRSRNIKRILTFLARFAVWLRKSGYETASISRKVYHNGQELLLMGR